MTKQAINLAIARLVGITDTSRISRCFIRLKPQEWPTVTVTYLAAEIDPAHPDHKEVRRYRLVPDDVPDMHPATAASSSAS